MSKFYDTLLWEYINNPWIRGLSLDKLAERNFNYEMISFDNIVKKQKLSDFSEVDLDKASKYSAEDVYITNKLYLKQKEENITENKVLNDIELPLVIVLKQVEIDWVKIDRDRLKELWTKFENEIIKLSNSIYEEVWEEFNISSPKQVWEILFEKLKLPKWKKTKTWYSVNSEVLENLSKEFSIAKKIIDYRHYSKLNSTYIIWLLDLLDKNDFLHTSYNQAVTTTWRLSSTNPNLQNIPSWKGIAWEIRSAFISRFEEWKIMAFDYSQVELRLLAIMSNDKNLIEAFNKWYDIHSRTAELIWTTDRRVAKAVNFWVIYWISGFGLSKMINISVAEANNYIKRFFEIYPDVRKYLDNTIKFCEENWYVETLF
jgi:DNA polymerase-1